MADDLELSVEQGHLITTNTYDDALNLTGSHTLPKPGYQFNGHRSDCRCTTCRPDIWRLSEQGEGGTR